MKSQSRRLYDVANVLIALGIIEKIKYKSKVQEKNHKERRNAYKWIGSSGYKIKDQSESAQRSFEGSPFKPILGKRNKPDNS